ncbi:MAG: TetR/AcrR family transcriptional regulator [Propionibacteriaceae bacterium]|jgi:AcrR family transcriptional regulator|nr:TetR/AcrR family transcriptional regulator [Propionibacteriaceae bacterium]
MNQLASEGLRARLRDQTRREIAGAALGLFDTQGYKATTMEDVARAAGVSPRTVYRHFPTKAELVFGWLPEIATFVEQLTIIGATPAGILSELEQTIQQTITEYADTDVAVGEQYQRFQHLIAQDSDLQAILAQWEQRLVASAQRRLGELCAVADSDPSLDMVIELVIAPVKVALGLWAKSPADSLAALYERARRARGDVLGFGPA